MSMVCDGPVLRAAMKYLRLTQTLLANGFIVKALLCGDNEGQ